MCEDVDGELQEEIDELIGKEIVGIDIDTDEEAITFILSDNRGVMIVGEDLGMLFLDRITH